MTAKKKNSSHLRRFHLSTENKTVLFIIFGILFLASTAGFIILALKNPDCIVTPHNDKDYSVVIIRTIILYLFVAGAIFLIRLLWERLTGEFFSNIIAILAAVILSGEILQGVIKYFLEAYNYIWLRILLVCSLLSFGYLITAIIGFFPMYTHQLKECMRKNLLYRDTSGYTKLHYGAYFKVDVLKVHYIPQSIDRLDDSAEKDMKKVLRRFVSRWGLIKHPERFILIGGFGSGKTTALQEVVEAKLKHTFFHNGGIPVYVSLRDWLKDDTDLSEVRSNKKDLTERTQHSDLFEKLFRLVTGDDKKTNTDDPLWNVFLKLHDDRRLIYVFDGLNELLQRNIGDDDKKNQQYARNIAAFLYHFASGNRCIISMCELQNVITTQSICIDDKDQYEMYAVKGVHLDHEQVNELQKYRWMEKLIPYVALYRLAKKSLSKDDTPKSTYTLLSEYVDDQLKRELISLDDLSLCYEAVYRAIAFTSGHMTGASEVFSHSPYSGLQINPNDKKNSNDKDWFQYLCDAHLFYMDLQESDGNQKYPKYHASHILYHEFFLAKYAYNLFFDDSNVKKIIKNPTKWKKQVTSFTAYFCGNAGCKPNLLEYTYLRAVFSMVIIEIIKNAHSKDLELAQCAERAYTDYLGGIYKWIESNNANVSDRNKFLRKYLVLLSQLNDDLSYLPGDHKADIPSFIKRNTQIMKEVRKFSKNPEIDISERFALAKMLKDDQDNKHNTISSIRDYVLDKKWTYLSIQREVLLYSMMAKKSDLAKNGEDKGE